MAIKQLSVFVENKQGSMVSITDILSKQDINIRALSIAETQDFGMLRLIVNDTAAAEKILTDEGYLIKVNDVVGVKIGDTPGKLSAALNVLNENKINMDYLYAFMSRTEKHAYVVVRVEDNAAAEKALEDKVFAVIRESVKVVETEISVEDFNKLFE